ncbi:MAG: immune inhibitor A, partial [Candidatus Krumholzibacteria bacterium]|nr:immune inhibitor A [Candidatus Krumholzibacteria bacterium]
VSRFGYATYTTAVTVIADDIVTLDVTLNQLPSGTIAGFVTDSESGMGIETDITVRLAGENVLATSTNPSTGEYSVVLPIGTYDLVYSPVFPYPVTMRTGIDVFDGATTTVDVTLDRAQVLIVDDDTGDPYETYYENAVTAAGRSYLTVTTPPSAADMAPFETVIWFTGDDFSTTLTADDQTNIAVYLDAGGRLFITGQDIGYDIRGSAFYADYLHAVYVQDDVSLGAVIGEIGNPIGYGFSFDIQGGSGANNQAYPSEIDVIYPGQTAFIYDESVLASAVTGNGMEKGQVATDGITSSGTAALTYDGAYKLVYLAFGFEAVAEETTRNMLMGRILDWLLGYPEIAHEPLGNTEDTENPFRVSAYITSAYFDLDPSTFVLVYDVGEGDIAVPMASTGVPDEYEAYIPEQGIDTEVYYYIAASDVEGHTSTHPMGAPMNRHMFQVGWDDEPPTVVHVRHYNTNDLEGPYHIYAEMYDNFGIESAYLMCSKNGGMFHRVKMIQGEDGRYHGEILGPSVVGDVYEYHLYAMDKSYHGNVTQVPESGEFSFEIVEFFLWDFELDDGGFVESGNIWEWGEPTSGPGGANSGVKLWGTNLDGSYPNNADATLDMPPITLSASKPYALLTFWHWYYIETNYDGGNVKVSADDGETWEVVTPLGGYDGTAKSGNAGIPGEPCFTGYNDDFWQMELFDLSAYAGSQVIIRFHFGSDGSMYRDGWYVDDVMVRSSDTDDIPPIISGTEVPTSTFDPTGPYNVSANIVDFLGDVSGAYIFYSTDDGMTWTETAMTEGADDEWSG